MIKEFLWNQFEGWSTTWTSSVCHSSLWKVEIMLIILKYQAYTTH